MSENLEGNMEDFIDEKEKLLYQIEMSDITILLYYFNNLYSEKQEMEEKLQKKSNSKKAKKKYNECIEEIELIENDEDIQNAIYSKLKDIDYNEDSIESRAIAIHSIGAAIWLSDVLSKIEEESNLPIEELIADIVEDMKTEDLIQVLEIVGYNKIMNFQKVHNVFCNKLDEMTNGQFIIYFANCISSKYAKTEEFKTKCIEKIRNGNKDFIPFFINAFSDDDKIIEELLNNVSKEQKVSAIISAGVNKKHNKKVTSKLNNMIKSLSEEEFVRLLCVDTGEENAELIQNVLEKMFNLSNDNLKFLLFTYYENVEPTYKHAILDDLIITRNMTKEENGAAFVSVKKEELEEFAQRYKVYYCSDIFWVAAFPYFSGFDLAKLDGSDSEVSNQNMVNTFKANEATIENYYKFIDYIGYLSKTKDEDLCKTILNLNKNFNIPEDMDADLKLYLSFIEMYLLNRILNFEDDKLLNKMYLLSENDAPLDWPIKIRRKEKQLTEPDILEIKGDNSKNFEKSNNNEGTKENNESDNSREL